MKEILIVDGYNIIGSWPLLRQQKDEDFEVARLRLLEVLSEYQAFTGREVYVVFDAHRTPAPRTKETWRRLKVLYTKADETADELIERLVHEWEKRKAHIYVATSDAIEQQVTFGAGALRISARELRRTCEQAGRQIERAVADLGKRRTRLEDRLDPKIAERLEKWRREE